MPETTSVPSTPPETASATPPPTRRRALATLGWAGSTILCGAALGHSLADAAEAIGPGPDRDVIRACDDFIAAHDRIDARPKDEDLEEDGPLMLAYDRAIDALCDAKATTMDGLIAKARAANHMAQAHPGEGTNGTIGQIAWSIVGDLMQLSDGRAV